MMGFAMHRVEPVEAWGGMVEINRLKSAREKRRSRDSGAELRGLLR